MESVSLLYLATALSCFFVLSTGSGTPPLNDRLSQSRAKRQLATNFVTFNSLSNPLFYQLNNQLPTFLNQIAAARCQASANQQALPFGCSYTPIIVDRNNVIVNCQLDCSFLNSFFPLSPLGQFSSASLPGTFNVVDQSNLDNFLGDSYYVFPPSTTTTTTTTMTTSNSNAASTVTGTATTTATTPTVATVPTATPPLSPEALIEACINAGIQPNSGCSFNGQGTPPPALACAETCMAGDTTVFGPCDPSGTMIDMCLCQNPNGEPTPPRNGCTYTFRGSTSPLTCSQLCVPMASPFG